VAPLVGLRHITSRLTRYKALLRRIVYEILREKTFLRDRSAGLNAPIVGIAVNLAQR